MSPLFLGPLVVAGISAALALVIAITDRFVNDYGVVTVDINGGKKRLEVRGGSPLLATLASRGLFVPSACGGKGSCGACKVKVLSDVGPHLPTETPYMTPEEIAGNVRLACQIKLKKDIAISIPEELFSVRKFPAVVERMVDLTYDIKEVTFRLEEGSRVEFEPGQYVQLQVPAYGDFPGGTQRAYSMSSVPAESGKVELLIRLVPGGIATTWVHKYLKEGDSAELVGPFGEFRVRDTDATMVCVAGGSGMAPFRSMLRHMKSTGAFPGKDIWYFFGARSLRDMFYLDELAALEAEWPRFHFVPALSEPKGEDGWTGATGLITDVLDRYMREKLDPARPKEGYLCGSPGMIGACTKVMTDNGIPIDKIYYDKFA